MKINDIDNDNPDFEKFYEHFKNPGGFVKAMVHQEHQIDDKDVLTYVDYFVGMYVGCNLKKDGGMLWERVQLDAVAVLTKYCLGSAHQLSTQVKDTEIDTSTKALTVAIAILLTNAVGLNAHEEFQKEEKDNPENN